MKRKKIVAGNWKMNMTMDESIKLIAELEQISENNIEIKIAPAYTNLYKSISLLMSSQIEVIAQNLHQEKNGAYTGEISAEMLADNKIVHSIVGHSERRTLLAETNEKINIKIKQLLSHNITPILCIGENLEQRDTNTFKQVIDFQLETAFKNIKIYDQTIIIAYEPIWSIGTGVIPEISQINEAHEFIKTKMKQLYPKNVNQFKIAYGGSVNLKNYNAILSSVAVDGVLVGGASLDSRSFYEICNFKN